MHINGEEANNLIQAFYDAIVARERDELATLNDGLHRVAVDIAGYKLYCALTGETPIYTSEEKL